MSSQRVRTRWLDINYLLLFLLLLSGSATTLRAAEPPASESRLIEKKEQRHRFMGVWALVDHANNLFNVRLSPNGRAISTSGSADGTSVGTQPHVEEVVCVIDQGPDPHESMPLFFFLDQP